VPGRKTDVLDCQWLQELHTFGLLRGAFRPEEPMCVLRAFLRQRANLVRYAGMHIQHMQKALNQMNLHLHHVVSDITGVTGMKIIRAILDGERDPQVLAQHRDRRCRQSVATIAKALQGSWREEHLFALRQAVELFDFYQHQLARCDEEIARVLARLDPVTDANAPPPVRKHKVRSPDLVSGSGRPVIVEPRVITTDCSRRGPRQADPGCHLGRILKRYRITPAGCERVALCHSIALLR
jgi:hypothetical protein